MSINSGSTKITALYERLSRDDEQKNESISIANQKQILEDYCRKNNFRNFRHFIDDGVTGTVFNRPGLNAMLEEVRAGNVATVIIKDQSRIGRDVVEIGLLKRTFEEHNVRFIAAQDGLDTANGFDIMSILRDVINEFYVADTSRKIKAVFKSRMENGVRCSGSIPYGYLADAENKGQWVIDEDAAAVVRRIFQMVIDGKGVSEIGRILRAEKIPIPTEHWKRIGAPTRCTKYADPYAWSSTTLIYLLRRPEYMGRKVLGKTVKESYKSKKLRKTAPEEQFVFDGEVPVIVDEETWNNAQRLRKTVRRSPKKKNPPHRLTGILYCADCGYKLTHRVSLVQKKWIDDSFICSSYRKLTRDCAMHYIPTKSMESLILSAIQRVSWYVRKNEAEFTQRVQEVSVIQQEETIKECKRRLSQSQKRHTELDGLVKTLYESFATGKLPEKHFERLLTEYDGEQLSLESSIKDLQEQIDAWSEDRLKTDRFIELVKRYTEFSELTTPMLNEFVEKVIVYEGENRGAARRQRIDIHFNFIGAFEVPADIVTPMDVEEQRRQIEEKAAKEKRAKEYEQERNEKRKQERQAFAARKKAGLLTPEELEADNQRIEHHRAWQKEWRAKRKAAAPPKPPKPLSQNAIIKRKNEGKPLTPEELEIYEAWRNKRTEQHRVWRKKQMETRPPKLPKERKPTKKEIMSGIIARKNAGDPLTSEELEMYRLHREACNAKHKKWRDAKAEENPEKFTIEDMKKRIRDGLTLTPEQAAFYASWKDKKNQSRREFYHSNKMAMPDAAGL